MEQALIPYAVPLKRLRGLDFAAGLDEYAWEELARALRDGSQNDSARAERIIDAFVRTPKYDDKGQLITKVPSPIELRMFAREVPEQPAPSGPLPDPCDVCSPDDWTPMERRGISGVRRCRCVRGQHLKARDASAWAEMERSRDVRLREFRGDRRMEKLVVDMEAL